MGDERACTDRHSQSPCVERFRGRSSSVAEDRNDKGAEGGKLSPSAYSLLSTFASLMKEAPLVRSVVTNLLI